ncbi:MAG: Na(+)-translocating NADH-quinone reductase subunit A [Bacteroidales bacterium]|jgi:Na+-transporting NADH:ubiquinone oxidoreductase subunit A|nr:Na(+)-translocating NADH-quinone reductase subunit A [Bacteroidales bacterium]
MPKVFKIRKGLNIKIKGESAKEILPFNASRFALKPDDFRWIVPKLLVNEGEAVKVGTPLFCDKENENLLFVSPASGTVKQIVRGEKRKIEYVEIESDNRFESVTIDIPPITNAQNITLTLQKYGLWNTIRELPFNRIARPNRSPKAIFISGFDTAPLAPDVSYLIENQIDTIQKGIDIITHLSKGKIYLSLYKKANNDELKTLSGIEFVYFTGKHPAGDVSVQIHKIYPINKGEIVWYIDLQSLIMIGKLFGNQKLDFSKKIAICGTGLEKRGYISIPQGAELSTFLSQNAKKGNYRIISGNILTGKNISQSPFAGYYHHQITVIPEGGQRRLFGWLAPGFTLWSYSRTYLAWLFPWKKFNPNSSLNGGIRPVIFNTYYDNVFPFDIFPAQLLKACIAEDIDLMENLGIYEVTEEDFALCEVICPSKIAWQEIILKGLTMLKD